jgi:hypothetical protein
MGHSFKMILWPTTLTTSAAAYVTNATSHTTQVHNIILHNTDTSAHVVDVYLVQNSSGSVGTASTSNRIMHVTVQASDTLFLTFSGSEALVLDANNDTLQAKADTSSVVVMSVKGDDIT